MTPPRILFVIPGLLAGLLLPAAVCLWLADRPAGFVAFVVVPVLVIVSPPLAAAGLIGLALIGPAVERIRGAGKIPATAGTS